MKCRTLSLSRRGSVESFPDRLVMETIFIVVGADGLKTAMLS